MSNCLGNIMHYSLAIKDATNILQEFYGIFSKQIDFINYFKDQWELQLSEYKIYTLLLLV